MHHITTCTWNSHIPEMLARRIVCAICMGRPGEAPRMSLGQDTWQDEREVRYGQKEDCEKNSRRGRITRGALSGWSRSETTWRSCGRTMALTAGADEHDDTGHSETTLDMGTAIGFRTGYAWRGNRYRGWWGFHAKFRKQMNLTTRHVKLSEHCLDIESQSRITFEGRHRGVVVEKGKKSIEKRVPDGGHEVLIRQ